ncbi:MAG: hypothetical protein DRI39_03355 [Chloroflexi bacterium]|nr:MAG: hypothetical protein DRI39_03355 [Chloroflexota bacterium]
MKDGVKVFNEDGEVIAVFYSIRREGDRLVMDGKALDVMRMDMIITLDEIVKGARMGFGRSLIVYVLLLPYFGFQRFLRRLARKSPR